MGRNIAGIIAAVLVFLGLIFLGFLVVPTLTDVIKVIAMFSFSALLFLAGLVLTRRHKNGFSLALLGTGLGAVFISVLITHLYFDLLGNVPAYLILLVWLAVCLITARFFDSVFLSVIAHIGMVFSVIGGYLGAVSTPLLYLLLAYQAAATVMLVGGTFIASKRTHLTALFVSLGLTVPASAVLMMSSFLNRTALIANQPLVYLGAFALQFVGATVLYALTLRASVRKNASRDVRVLILLASLLWLATEVVTVAQTTYKLLDVQTSLNFYEVGVLAVFVTAAITLVTAIVILTVFRLRAIGNRLERVLTIMLLAFSALILLISSVFIHGEAFSFGIQVGASGLLVDSAPYIYLPGLILISLAAAGAWAITQDRLYWYGAVGAVLLDLLLMLTPGFSRLAQTGTTLLAAGYLVVLLALLGGLYLLGDTSLRERWRRPYWLCVLISAQVGLAPVLLSSSTPGIPPDYRFVILMLINAALLLLAYFSPLAKVREGATGVTTTGVTTTGVTTTGVTTTGVASTLKLDELVIFVSSTIEFGIHGFFDRYDLPGIAFALMLTLLLLALAVLRISGRKQPAPGFDLIYAIATTLLLLSCLGACTRIFDEAYAFSLVTMILAFINIAVGFALRRGTLRIYGLILVLFCVVKLLVVDLVNLNSFMRVIAFIGCGLVCFGISALYNFAVKRLKTNQENYRTNQEDYDG
ncbi:MAG: DUF2339 domain-containing protein [Coriobacteriales bacterium]|nr:DUF2339 domain-containing protein [Coriobacteriales bacterium]